MKLIKRILGLFLITCCIVVNGQNTYNVTNIGKRVSSDGKQLIVEYDLNDRDNTQLYDVELRITNNKKIVPVNERDLTGDWGKKISPGQGKVILWDLPAGTVSDINLVTVDVLAVKSIALSASFSYQVLTSKAPFEVKFQNTSKNSSLFTWDFGDPKSKQENQSKLSNPTHVYKSGGNYTVSLTASNPNSNQSSVVSKALSLNEVKSVNTAVNTADNKNKKLRAIWIGSAVATAGAGSYFLVQSARNYESYKTATTNAEELWKKQKTNGIIGTACFVATGICASQIILQSMKIKNQSQAMNLQVIPLNQGGVVSLSLNF